MVHKAILCLILWAKLSNLGHGSIKIVYGSGIYVVIVGVFLTTYRATH